MVCRAEAAGGQAGSGGQLGKARIANCARIRWIVWCVESWMWIPEASNLPVLGKIRLWSVQALGRPGGLENSIIDDSC